MPALQRKFQWGLLLFIFLSLGFGAWISVQAPRDGSVSMASNEDALVPPNEPPIPPQVPTSWFASVGAPFPVSPECQEFVKALHYIRGRTFKFGWVETPENPLRNDLPPVYTFYYYQDNKAMGVPEHSHGQLPFAMFNGGPEADSHNTAFTFLKFPFELGLQMVFIDQRGNGCSSPYPTNRPPKDYLSWGTSGIVRDAEAVREKLGYARWNIFGQSFGSMIVQRYLMQAPQSVLRAIGHSGAMTADPSATFQIRYEQQMRVIEKYLSVYPGDRDVIKDIVHHRLCPADSSTNCGASYLQSKFQDVIGFFDHWNYLHQSLLALQSLGKSRPLSTSPNSATGSADATDIDRTKAIAGGFITLEYSSTITDAANCQRALQWGLNLLKDRELLSLSECWGSDFQGAMSVQDAQTWKEQRENYLHQASIPPIDPRLIGRQLEKNLQVEYYLFSSDFDYYMPAAILSMSAHQIGPRVHYQNLKEADHAAFRSPEVVRYMVDLPVSNDNH